MDFILGPLNLCYDCFAWGFCGTPKSGNGGVSLTILPAFETIFPLVGCTVQPRNKDLCLAFLNEGMQGV